jgi:hypothetical protein
MVRSVAADTSIGSNYCGPAELNSVGLSAAITATGSQGNLCIGSPLSRFNALIMQSDMNGVLEIQVPDLTSMPLLGPVLPGETWHLQAWYRDNNPASTSNFSDGTSVIFN